MKTVWLIGKVGDDKKFDPVDQDEAVNQTITTDEVPGEIFQHYNHSFISNLPIPRLGRISQVRTLHVVLISPVYLPISVGFSFLTFPYK